MTDRLTEIKALLLKDAEAGLPCCEVGATAHELMAEVDRLKKVEKMAKKVEKMAKKVEKMAALKDEYATARLCGDHKGKWERGTCVLCEVDRLTATFHHTHDALPDNPDRCRQCGLDIRHAVHHSRKALANEGE